MNIFQCNPFLRAAMIQPAVMEGTGLRYAYDHRLFFVLENQGRLITEDGEIPIDPNDLLLIPPRTGYYFRGRLRVAVLNFDLSRRCDAQKEPVCPPLLQSLRKEPLFDEERLEGLEKTKVIKTDALWRSRVTQLVNHFRSASPLRDARTCALLKELLCDVLEREISPDSPEAALAKKTDAYLKIHASQIRSNSDLANELGYHPVYLGEIYKKHFGLSLHRAILLERIALCCRWLTQTELSIEEIAFAAGFSSRSHFCTAFRKERGLSPHQYRKKQSQPVQEV